MRGKVRDQFQSVHIYRITPAYAGKSGIITMEVSYMQDHPRLCGEKACGSRYCLSEPGSPPPMRGKAAIAGLVAAFVGITPAYAGKSTYLLL